MAHTDESTPPAQDAVLEAAYVATEDGQKQTALNVTGTFRGALQPLFTLGSNRSLQAPA